MATLKLSRLADEEARQTSQLEALDKIVIPSDVLPEEKRIASDVTYVIFKQVKKKHKFNLDNCAKNVLNPKTGRLERIWYLDGAQSIWDSELNHILSNKERYERARRGMDIKFVDGVLRVRSTDLLLLEFLRANPHNIGKRRVGSVPGDFFEYDPQEEQKERMAKQLLKIEMVLKVKEMDVDKVRKMASFFGIAFNDELGQVKSPDGLRTELMLKADSDPVNFQKYVDSREVEVAFLVKRAIIENKIDLGGESRSATWANGKGFIAKVPASRKPLEYLTELAMTNSDEGKRFKSQLEEIIK